MVKPTTTRPAGSAPGRAQLHEAALRHMGRFAVTEAGLTRVLERRVQRWARAAAAEGRETAADVIAGKAEAALVAQALVVSGIVNDAAFAAARAARLVRAGRSRRAVAAHLAAKGVRPDVAEAALPEAEQELPAALAYARRRRLGPFREVSDAEMRLRDLGALARAGFSRDVAERALEMDAGEAEALVLKLKRG
jgi:regulatory protein